MIVQLAAKEDGSPCEHTCALAKITDVRAVLGFSILLLEVSKEIGSQCEQPGAIALGLVENS